MARHVFFSFYYEKDIWRANVVRNSWVTHHDREAAGFFDASLWEEAKKKGKEAIERMIDRGLENTTVTAVLIGAQTNEREYVDYEIEQSYNRQNGLIGIYIHQIEDQSGYADTMGANPLDRWHITKDGRKTYFNQLYPTYNWISDNGYQNFASWVETAARKAGR